MDVLTDLRVGLNLKFQTHVNVGYVNIFTLTHAQIAHYLHFTDFYRV